MIKLNYKHSINRLIGQSLCLLLLAGGCTVDISPEADDQGSSTTSDKVPETVSEVPLNEMACVDRNDYDKDNGDVLYLTFDDGPSDDENTQRVLDALAAYGAKATFFVTGKAVKAHPETLRKIVEGGHAIGLHSYNHVSYFEMNLDELTEDFVDTRNEVDNVLNGEVLCYRPPEGHTNPSIRDHAKSLGYDEVLWERTTTDWDLSRHPAEIMQVLSESLPNERVLLHDGPTQKFNTASAIEDWLAANQNKFDFKAFPACVNFCEQEEKVPETINGRPVCSSPEFDEDGDGYGWENDETCIVVD